MSIQDKDIRTLTTEDLLSRDVLYSLLEEPEEERARLSALCEIRASELGIQKQFERVLKAFNAANEKLAREYTRQSKLKNGGIQLDSDGTGKPIASIENFVHILEEDPVFDNLQFNLLTGCPEKVVDCVVTKWTNNDDAEYRRYCESKYKIHNRDKSRDALMIVCAAKSYHPLKEYIESIAWDNALRIERFLTKWTKCEDNQYTREVSRLIFAGGINRLYNAGCKFDYMPVLVGTQGEGKSTLVRELAMKDEWFTEVNEFDGRSAIENLEGAWICEVSELLALTRTKEQEAVKAFLSRQTDRMRTPYAERVEDRPRQCIMIGTTNKEAFLSDRTGNRRFLPVKVNQSGYDLFDHLDELKEDIRQCWAEAKYRLDHDMKMEPYLYRERMQEAKEEQQRATEDDYRVGLVIQYLGDKKKTCPIDTWRNALHNDFDMRRSDSNDIVMILQNIPGWKKDKNGSTFPPFGYQACWSFHPEDSLKKN